MLHHADLRVARMHVGHQNAATAARALHKVLQQPGADLVGQVVEQAGAVNEIKLRRVRVLVAPHGLFEQVMHRFMHQLVVDGLAVLAR